MKLSVALCTYNGGRFLPEQLASLAAQTRPPDEVVACDDGSSDDTVSRLEAFAAAAPFPVSVRRNPVNLGSTKNFERAFGLCSGDVIAPCDQDDRWLPDKLLRLEREFAGRPGVGLAFSDAWLGTPALEPTARRLWADLPFTPAMQADFAAGGGPRVLLKYNVVTGTAMAFRADLRDILLPIPEPWVHDYWVAAVASAAAEAVPVAAPLLVYRQHGGQQIGVTKRTLARQLRAAFSRIDAAYFDRMATCFERLADRLDAHRGRLREPGLADLFREKAAFARGQQRLRNMGRLRRAAAAAGHLAAGRYHRFGYGLKSFAVDLLLR